MSAAATPAELLVHAGEGDRHAFAELWEALGGPVLALARRVTQSEREAEETTVRVFATAWNAAATFDPERDAIGWMFAIGWSVLRDEGYPLTAEAAVAELEMMRLHAAVRALPAKERFVIDQTYGGELSQREIAVRTGWSLGTVKTRTRNAFAHLAEELADVEELL